MLHIHRSNRLECLAARLAEHLDRQPFPHPLAPCTVAVPHPGVGRWLALYLAERDRIAMNHAFPLVSRCMWQQVRRLCGEAGDGARWTREVMAWSIYAQLLEVVRGADPVFEAPRRYIERTGAAGGAYQLAAEVADLFEQYLLYRPEMLRGWQDGEDAQDWQACLWRRLAAGQVTPADQLQAALQAACERPAGGDEEPLRLFAVPMLPPVWMDLLDALSRSQDVHLYVLQPSREWWGDLRARRLQLRDQARQARLGQPVSPPDAETLAMLEVHPLLARLGRQQQILLDALAARDAGQGDEIWQMPKEKPGGDGALAALQRSMLDLDAESARCGRMDGSLRIVSAHSPLREVQALHDWLLERFEADPSLRPRDVVVMAPEIERYAPVVEAVFDLDGSGRGERLPASLADRRAVDADPLVRAFLELLDLPTARFDRSWVLDRMRLPGVRSRWGWDEEALQRIEGWLDAAAIYRGLDAEHMQAQGLPPGDAFTWRQGLRRLLLGAVMGDAEVVLEGAGLATVPNLADAEALRLAGSLMQFIDRLQEARIVLQQERPAEAWSTLLLGTMQDLHAETPETQAGWERIRTGLREWLQSVRGAGLTSPLPLPVVRAALRRSLGEREVQGGYLSGRVSFCSLVPLRSVPFRIVCLLGMSADAFPRNRPSLPFDKMAEEPRWGDRSRREDDLQLFLESVLAARDGLYISHVGRSIRDDSPCEPASPVKTLMELMGIEEPVQLPLQPFDLRHYTPGDPLHSYDRRWLELARHLTGARPDAAADEDEEKQAITKPPRPQLPERIPLDFIVKLLDDPVGQYADKVLGLRLDEVERDPEAEPFVLRGLQLWKIRDRWLREALADPQRLPVLKRTLLLGGGLPAAPHPEAELDEAIEPVEAMASRLREAAGEEGPQWCEREVDPGIGHKVLLGYWQCGKQIFLASPSKLRPRHRAHAHLLACVLRASNEDPPSIHVLAQGNKGRLVAYDCPDLYPDAQRAREGLKRLFEVLAAFWSAPVALPLDAWFSEEAGKGMGLDGVRRKWQTWWTETQGGERPAPAHRLPYALFWSEGPEWQDPWTAMLETLWSVLAGDAG